MAYNSEKRARLKVVDLNPHLSCILCGGYFIDATTITECLHSFCRACIVRYLETSKYCPVCEVQVHKTRPLRSIRSDKLLQDIVYKLVPGLYENEMMRRRELYASQPPEAIKESRDEEDRGEGLENRYLYTSDELFCLALTYRSNETEPSGEAAEEEEEKKTNVPPRRFLRCPATMKINHLKKFIRVKFAIPKYFQVILQSKEEEIMDDDYSLMDVAYISCWKRNGPIELFFRIMEKPKVIPKPVPSSDAAISIPEAETSEAPAVDDGERQNPNSCPGSEQAVDSEKCMDSNACDNVTAAVTALPGTTENPAPEDDAKNPEEVPPKSPEATPSEESPPEASENSKNSVTVSEQMEAKSSDVTEESSAIKTSLSKTDTTDSGATESCTEQPKTESKDSDEPPPPKVPKLTISLTPEILQMAAQHAEDDRMDLDSELYEGRLVIAEPELSPKSCDDDLLNNKDLVKSSPPGDFDESKKDVEMMDDDEVDSGRGSDSSSRAEARSLFGDDDLDSPESVTVRTPDLEKNSFGISSPSPLPSPVKNGPDSNTEKNKVIEDVPKPEVTALPVTLAPKDDFGVLDLSTCHRKRGEDRLPVCRPKQCANPPVLDKFRQTTPCLPLPDHPSFKTVFPAAVPAHCPPMYKKPDFHRGNFRVKRDSFFAAYNPDPNGHHTKIVIKNLDPRPDHRHHHHHHHHHHGHHHHHQKM